MEKKGKYREILLTVLVLAVIIALALNSTVYYFRADMTDEKIFTISGVSERLFEEIEDQVNITYYVSEKLENYSSIPTEVRDLLDEYRAHANGRVSVEVIDPVESGLAGQVEALGIGPRQIEIVERNEKTYANIYTGIVIRYLDAYETLPFVVSTETLEYEITKAVRGLVDPVEKRIAVLVGDESRNLEKDYSGMVQQLERMFTVEELAPGDGVDPAVDVLVVLGNHDLVKDDLVPLEDYIMQGGNALFCVDGVFVDMYQNLAAEAEEDSPLLDMLAHYGVRVEPELVLDAYARNFRVPRQIFGQIGWQIIGPYPHWIKILPGNVSGENPITSRLTGLDLLWPSPLSVEEKDSVESEVLLRTSNEAWTMKGRFDTDPYRGKMMIQTRGEDLESFVLGVLLTGNVPRYTGSGNIRSEESRIIVIGDADFASNLIQYSESGYNLLFLENTVEWLTRDDDLLEIKTRPLGDTRLNRKEPEQARAVYVSAQVINVVILPLAVLLFGILRVRRRRRQRKEVQ